MLSDRFYQESTEDTDHGNHSTRDRQGRLYWDDRAVSIAVGYVLGLGIATLLFSALLIGGSGLIESQTRSVTSDELSVTGQRLAADLSGADRLVWADAGVDSGDLSELSVQSDLPDRVAAGGYTIEISHSSPRGTIELRSSSPDVVVSVPFRTETKIQNGTVDGGPVEIGYNDTDTEEQLEVNSV